MIKNKIYHLLSVVLLCTASLYITTAYAQSIDYIDAVFAVEYNHKPSQGKNHLKVQRNQQHYTVDFELDHWLLSSSQKASFVMSQCEVEPNSYLSKSKRPLKDEVTQTLEFDWEQKKAKYQTDNEQKPPNPPICGPKLRLPFG